ncbi:hypothetical protein AVEN_103027-1 [Araneus ventricosus]|uniref:Uncharacterized protein n=1 Tax=Araneus ventricosus TaxID=182803 RepID=A0A4Y2B8L5_ARAVE|nr:hypothetical protein AVEN_103027-1 [Araneus ventricosus]
MIDRFIRTINGTGTASGIQRLPNRWKQVGHNVGDCIKWLIVGLRIQFLSVASIDCRTVNRTGTASGIRRLPHRWKLFGHNVGDYIEKLVVGFETRIMLGKTLEALTNAESVVIIRLPLLILQPSYSIHVCCFD